MIWFLELVARYVVRVRDRALVSLKNKPENTA